MTQILPPNCITGRNFINCFIDEKDVDTLREAEVHDNEVQLPHPTENVLHSTPEVEAEFRGTVEFDGNLPDPLENSWLKRGEHTHFGTLDVHFEQVDLRDPEFAGSLMMDWSLFAWTITVSRRTQLSALCWGRARMLLPSSLCARLKEIGPSLSVTG